MRVMPGAWAVWIPSTDFVIFAPGGILRKRVLHRPERERHNVGDHKGRPYTNIDGARQCKERRAVEPQIHTVVRFNLLRDRYKRSMMKGIHDK